jgi:hypothetical protein
MSRIFLLFTLLFSLNAHAGLLLEIGQSTFEKPPNHTWWQDVEGWPHRFDMNSLYWRVGYFEKVSRRFSAGLSIFDLGEYSTLALASSDEQCVWKNGRSSASVCGGSLNWFDTKGSMRGIAVSMRYNKHIFFAELGATYTRQTFNLETDHPVSYSAKLSGPGYMIGAGVQGKHVTAGVYIYETNVGGDFGRVVAEFPAGVGKATVFSLGYLF